MNFNTLHYLVVLAQERSFARAAKRLFVVQPTLRQAIASLEQDLGTQLFVRGSSPLVLTPAGSIYVRWAQDTLQAQDNTVQRIAELVQGQTRLGMAMTYSLAMIHVPALTPAFALERPNCILDIWERNSTNGQRALESGQDIQLMVGTLVDPAPILKVEFLCREEMVLAIPKDHPLCPAGDRLDFSTLREMPFLQLSNNQSHTLRLHTICADYGFSPRTRLRSNGYNSLLQMVNAGLGAALMPEDFVRWQALPNVAAFSIDHPDNSRVLNMAWRKDQYMNQDILAMMELIRRQVGRRHADS